MAISKRNSRPITVEGKPYRWVFKENSGWNDITVQHADGQGQKLIVQAPWTQSGSPSVSLGPPKTPADVSDMIQKAIKMGWTPEVSGAPLRLKLVGTALQPVDV